MLTPGRIHRLIDHTLSQQINRRIVHTEANWLNSDGIPGRPWFKHILYAARYTCAHLELPGLTEAIERSDWEAAAEQGKILEDVLAKTLPFFEARAPNWQNDPRF